MCASIIETSSVVPPETFITPALVTPEGQLAPSTVGFVRVFRKSFACVSQRAFDGTLLKKLHQYGRKYAVDFDTQFERSVPISNA